MKKIHMFLDESSHLKSTSFCVRGFYFIEDLEEYLNVHFYEEYSKNIKIIVKQDNSIINWCIRYCDCFVKMLASYVDCVIM